MRGAKPIPTNLKLLRGNPGRRPLPENEPQVPEGEIVPPEWLSDEAIEIFRSYEVILKSMNVLTIADVDMLAVLAATQQEFVECNQDVQMRGRQVERTVMTKDGREIEVYEDNPAVKMGSDAGKRVKALMVEFGLSPSSRTRVKAQPKVEKDPLAELLARRGS
ncbi:MAG: phage terminase small subunit P27 family [Acidobacteriota bacterium]|nr:phage terminase small subunit P27 family [Acidobacteriota bacterium]